jgi:AcrR family transcriptional regulator
MENSVLDTQSRIIATAVDMIGRQINLNFTIREIAEKAGVNIASVNYYFRSKDNLINEVERHFINEISLTYEELKKSGQDPNEQIRKWAMKTMESLMEYPGIIFLIVTRLLSDRSDKAVITEMLDMIEQNLVPFLKKLTEKNDKSTVSIKIMQLLSGVIAPMLFYYGAGKTFNLDITDKDERLKYIDHLVSGI